LLVEGGTVQPGYIGMRNIGILTNSA
jgi:hypothetical protein